MSSRPHDTAAAWHIGGLNCLAASRVDLLAPLTIAPMTYDAVVSAGIFTDSLLGP
jgi:hypothetical protein